MNIKDITIGQYFPGKSVVHRMDARFKLCLEMLYIAMLFTAKGFMGLSAGFVFLLMTLILSKTHPRLILKSLKPIIPILIFTLIMNLFFLRSGRVLWQWSFISLTDYGLFISAFMLTRIVLLIAGCSILTYTTSPIQLTDALEFLLNPLKKIRFPVHECAMMMTIALRFIPTLIDETDKIMTAQKARGTNFETGGLLKRAKALIPILIPLFVSCFRRADELATAMECRCYRGGEGRTKYNVLKSGTRDYAALVFTLLIFALVIATRFVDFYVSIA